MTKFFTLESSINIAGIKITTNNIEAFQVIPAFWGRFFSEKISSKICNKISEDIYAVYSDFENTGVNSDGLYSYTIGCAVEDVFTNLDNGMSIASIPAGKYVVFDDIAKPDNVGLKWQKIWNYDFGLNKRTHFTEFEKYSKDGLIEIFIGVR